MKTWVSGRCVAVSRALALAYSGVVSSALDIETVGSALSCSAATGTSTSFTIGPGSGRHTALWYTMGAAVLGSSQNGMSCSVSTL